jgi:hypothetical protein
MVANMLGQSWQQYQCNNGKNPGAMGESGDNVSSTTAKISAQQGQLMLALH